MGKVITQRHLTIPQRYIETVGAVTFYWATFEHELVDLIGLTLGIGKKERRILMAKMDPKAKIAMLRVVGSKYVKRQETRTHINNLAKVANAMYDMRSMFVHGAWVCPQNEPDAYELLVIDSGEAAYLPKRMTISDEGRVRLVAQFKELAAYTRKITNIVAIELSPAKPDDSDSSVTGESEAAAPLVVPKNVTNSE